MDENRTRGLSAGLQETFMRILFLLLFILLWVGPALAASGPLEAVSLANKAIETSDVDLFRSVVDMNALLENASEDIRQELVLLANKGQLKDINPAVLAVLNDSDGLASKFALQLFAQDIKDYVAIGIRNGYFSGRQTLPSDMTGPFPGIMKKASHAKKEIQAGRVLSQKGDRAVVSATLVDHQLGSFPLELGLAKTERGWEVDSLANVRSLVKGIAAKKK